MGAPGSTQRDWKTRAVLLVVWACASQPDPEAWRMNGTLQTWRPIGKTGLTPENSEDEDEEDGLMIVAAAAPRE